MNEELKRAQPGPQRAFSRSTADIAIYGGAAGGGKSHALLLEAVKWVHVPKYKAVIFRRHVSDITEPGGLWDDSHELYGLLGGRAKLSPKPSWNFPNGARIGFDHLEHEHTAKRHQGRAYAVIGFDEATHFTAGQFWYLLSRNRSVCGVNPYVRLTCNPDPDSFVRTLVDWWIDAEGSPILERSGVLRWFIRNERDELVWADTREELLERYPEVDKKGNAKYPPRSLTFIPARLEDNPALTEADPHYRAQLLALPKVERERLLGGNWNIKPAAGLYFKRPMFRVLEHRPFDREVKRRIRAWDKAATPKTDSNDPDWTCGVLLAELVGGGWVIEHTEWVRGAPGEVERVIRATAELDGVGVEVAVWQDPGQAGVVDVDRMRTVLAGFGLTVVRASQNKLTYAGVWQSQAEGLRIAIVRGPWNEQLLAQLEAFPTKGVHDDGVDALSLAFQLIFGNAIVENLLAAYARA
jgi:predicted phage terminase large subunit-like protein